MKTVFLSFIIFYQKFLSPDTGFPHRIFPGLKVCRFTPTCSYYTYEAIEKYGTIRGIVKGLRRIIRCNPWNKGGPDPLI